MPAKLPVWRSNSDRRIRRNKPQRDQALAPGKPGGTI